MSDDATRAVLARYDVSATHCLNACECNGIYCDAVQPSENGRFVLYDDAEAMAARIAELERDAKRLDWIVGKLKVDVLQTMKGTMRPFLVMDRDWPLHPDTPRKSNVRAAIDAAMQEATHD